jgi:hypothetical protein
VISQRLRAFSIRSRTRRSAALRTGAARNNLAIFPENIAQHHRILHRRAAALTDVRGRAVSGVAEQRDLAAHQGIEGLNVMDFNAVGCLRIEGGNQFLHRGAQPLK